MKTPLLKVQPREPNGKSMAAKIRRQGLIPAVCYGVNKKPLPLSVDPEQLFDILKSPAGLNSLIELQGAEETRMVFVQNIQRDPVERNILHVDFIYVDTSKPVQRKVALNFVGKPEGVVTGGVLQVIRRQIEVEALPTHIPDSIDIDVQPLLIGQSIHIEEVKLPEGVRAIFDRTFSVCAVIAPSLEKEETVVAAEGEPEEGAAAKEGAAAESKDQKAQDAGDAKK